MGIVTKVNEVTTAINQVIQVLKTLNPDRAVVLEVQNLTNKPLKLATHEHVHGGFSEPPSIVIPPGQADVFGSTDISVKHGTEGKVTYESEEGFLFKVEWNNPVLGSTSCNATVVGSNSGNFEPVSICGAGHTAHMQYSVFPGSTARPIVRKGSITAGPVSEIAVANNGTRGVITAVRADKRLRLINWELDSDGMAFKLIGDSLDSASDATDIHIARGRLFVTACRAANENLLLISWEVQGQRIVRRGDSRDGSGKDRAGKAGAISIVALSDDIFVTALRTGSGNLMLITWRLENTGELTRLADSGGVAGAVSEISLARVTGDSRGNHRVVTAVRGGDGKLLLISWRIPKDGSSITRLSFDHGLAGFADSIRVVTTAGGLIVTAMRGNLSGNPPSGNLLLISWSIDQNGALARLGDTPGQAGAILSNALTRSSGGVLSAVGSRHGLKLIKWSVSPQGAIKRVADSGEQAESASLISLCPEPLATEAATCTVVRSGSGKLILVAWADD